MFTLLASSLSNLRILASEEVMCNVISGVIPPTSFPIAILFADESSLIKATLGLLLGKAWAADDVIDVFKSTEEP